MSYVLTDTAIESDVLATALTHLKNGKINDATACFAEHFQFNDRGIGLAFHDKKRLAEFFQTARELYPGSSLETDRILISGNHVITEWTLRTTLADPFCDGFSPKVPISLPGVSIARIENGKITDWTDYYDGLTARRTALAAHFVEWIAL
jgi:hypothetical protein